MDLSLVFLIAGICGLAIIFSLGWTIQRAWARYRSETSVPTDLKRYDIVKQHTARIELVAKYLVIPTAACFVIAAIVFCWLHVSLH